MTRLGQATVDLIVHRRRSWLVALLLVLVSSTASQEFRWKEALIAGVVLGAAAAALFVRGLGVPLPIWPGALDG